MRQKINVNSNESPQRFRKEVQKLSYEESLEKLEFLLNQLQDDSLPVNELKSEYVKGKIYLEHCEKLLQDIEQTIINLDSKDQDVE